MIIIERRYKEYKGFNNYIGTSICVDKIDRRAFRDDDYSTIQGFINQDGEYTYMKL